MGWKLPRQTIFPVRTAWAKKAHVASRKGLSGSIKRIPFIRTDIIQIFPHS